MRPTNQDLLDALAKELTEGVEPLGPETVAATREWRRRLWALVRELRPRLCPRPGDES